MSYKSYTLISVAEIIHETVKAFDGEKYYMATGDLSNEQTKELEFVTYENRPSRADLTAKKDDVILARMKSTNKVLLVQNTEADYIYSTGFIILRPSKEIDNNYLLHFLQSTVFQDEKDKLCTGATQKAINNQNFANLQIPLPPLPIQKRIAEILDAADALKRKDQALLKKYDELAQAIFIDMFGDPVKNEKGWEVGVFGDYISVLTDYHSNGSYETLRQHVTLKNVPDYALMVRTTDLEKNDFTDNVNYISKEAYEHLEKSKVFGGEIIINKIGSAGNIYLMPFLNRPVSLGMNSFLVRLNESLNPVFAFHFLNTDFGKYEISKRVFGAVTKTITKEAVRSIPMFKIPKKQQDQYVECITKINSLINCGNSFQSDLLFNSLIQKAFKGELVAE